MNQSNTPLTNDERLEYFHKLSEHAIMWKPRWHQLDELPKAAFPVLRLTNQTVRRLKAEHRDPRNWAHSLQYYETISRNPGLVSLVNASLEGKVCLSDWLIKEGILMKDYDWDPTMEHYLVGRWIDKL